MSHVPDFYDLDEDGFQPENDPVHIRLVAELIDDIVGPCWPKTSDLDRITTRVRQTARHMLANLAHRKQLELKKGVTEEAWDTLWPDIRSQRDLAESLDREIVAWGLSMAEIDEE